MYFLARYEGHEEGVVRKRRARLPSGKRRTGETLLIESPEAEETREHRKLG
jgi:hypothetical protein